MTHPTPAERAHVPSANGNGVAIPNLGLAEAQQLEDAQRVTDEDLARFFTAQVEHALLRPEDPDRPRWITVAGETFRWVGTHYEPLSEAWIKRKVVEIARVTVMDRGDGPYHPFIKPTFIAQAIDWLHLRTAHDAADLNPPGLINCRNGVLRLDWTGNTVTPVLEDHDPDRHLFTDPPGLAYDPDVDRSPALALLGCIADSARQLFLQVAAASLDVDTVRRRGHRIPALLMIGSGENGKDTLGDALTALHGRSSTATISIKDWKAYEEGQGRGRFVVSQLDRARLSICSENSGAFKLDNLESLKAAITGDRLYSEAKHRQGHNISPRAVFLFFLNSQPLLDGGSAAIASRWGLIKMPHTYSTRPTGEQLRADPRFKHDPEFLAGQVLPGLLNILIETLPSVVARGFSLEDCADDLQALRESTCHLHQFLKDSGYEPGTKADSVELLTVWERLQDWYRKNGWMEHRFGEWVFCTDQDGDKPVKAQRLLLKKLQQIHPGIAGGRGPGPDRRTLLFGLRIKR